MPLVTIKGIEGVFTSEQKAEAIRKALEKNNMGTICTIEDPIEYRILPEIDIIATIQINDTNSINNKILELFQNIDIDVYVKDDETFFMQRVSNSTQFFFSSKNLNFSEDDLFISQVKNKTKTKFKIHSLVESPFCWMDKSFLWTRQISLVSYG